jgi:nucleoid DNA-binding protein
MNLKELVEAVSNGSGVGADSVKKVLNATFATIHKELKGEEPVKLQGFGTLVRKPGKDGKEDRIVFRSPLSKAEREVKKQKKLTKKTEAAG